MKICEVDKVFPEWWQKKGNCSPPLIFMKYIYLHFTLLVT